MSNQVKLRTAKEMVYSKKTLIKFDNRKYCNRALLNQNQLEKLNLRKYQFRSGTKIFVNVNLTVKNELFGQSMLKSVSNQIKYLSSFKNNTFFERQYIQVWNFIFKKFEKYCHLRKWRLFYLCPKQFLDQSKRYIATFRFLFIKT